MDIIEEGSSKEGHDSAEDDKEDETESSNSIANKPEAKAQVPRSRARPAPLEILDRVKLNNTLETPRSTIKTVLKVPENTELKFSRENLKKVEARLKRAFVEFYQKLRLLKSFRYHLVFYYASHSSISVNGDLGLIAPLFFYTLLGLCVIQLFKYLGIFKDHEEI